MFYLYLRNSNSRNIGINHGVLTLGLVIHFYSMQYDDCCNFTYQKN